MTSSFAHTFPLVIVALVLRFSEKLLLTLRFGRTVVNNLTSKRMEKSPVSSSPKPYGTFPDFCDSVGHYILTPFCRNWGHLEVELINLMEDAVTALFFQPLDSGSTRPYLECSDQRRSSPRKDLCQARGRNRSEDVLRPAKLPVTVAFS